MTDVYLFSLASQRTAYLSARQTLIAQNVANANTPAYKAVESEAVLRGVARDGDRDDDDQSRCI